jgi:hypothetical protein
MVPELKKSPKLETRYQVKNAVNYRTYAEPFGVIDEMIGMMRCQFQVSICVSERGWLHDAAWKLKVNTINIYNDSGLIG